MVMTASRAVSKIAVDPLNANRVFVATSNIATYGGGTAGIWRHDSTQWFNMTAKVSNNRANTAGTNAITTAPPGTPGPDDNYLLSFPTPTAAQTWSDLAIFLNPNYPMAGPQEILFAALGTTMVTNTNPAGTPIGYSLTQESVDLNSYLASESSTLAQIADRLGDHTTAARYRTSATTTATAIQQHMYDPASGWFYDTALGSAQPLTTRGRGIEGAIPLWAGTATQEQAAAVRAKLLSPTEFKLLECLLRQPGRAFSRHQLMDAAIGEGSVVLERTIDVHVKTLRRKLTDVGAAPDLIETVRGVGYRFRETASEGA